MPLAIRAAIRLAFKKLRFFILFSLRALGAVIAIGHIRPLHHGAEKLFDQWLDFTGIAVKAGVCFR
jgi:hypothetical protein